MKTLSSFFRRLWLSFTSTEFYAAVWVLPLKQGFLFFAFWMLVIGLLSNGYFAYVQLPPLGREISASIRSTPAYFTEDTQVFLSGGTLYTEPELIEIPFPRTWLDTSAVDPSGTPELFAVITRRDTSATDWSSDSRQSALVYINNSTAAINSLSGASDSWNEFPLSDLTPETGILLNQDNIEEKSREYALWFEEIFPIIQAGSMAILILMLMFTRLTITLFESIFIYLLLKIFGKNVPFYSALNFSLFLIVPAEILNQIALKTWPNSPFSFLSLSFWLMAIYILFSIYKKLPSQGNNKHA